jgi:2-iminobutanoate/2-iminopropanoate deaminase
MESIMTDKAPAAIGPYSQAIRAGGLLFCSGQIPLDPVSGDMISGSIEEETGRVMENLQSVLEAGSASFEQVVKTTLYLTDMADFPAVNQVYGGYFPALKPARVTVAVAALPRGARIEIEAIAAL